MSAHAHAHAHAFAPAAASRFEPAALRAKRLFQSHDLDEARERISRVMQPHELRVPGAARTGAGAHMDFVRVGGIGLGTIDYGQPVALAVDGLDDYHLVMFCLRGHARTRVHGQPLVASTHEGVVCGPDRHFDAALSADCEQFVMRLDRGMVERHAGIDVRFHPQLSLDRPGLQAWLAQLRAMVGSPFLIASAERHPLIAVELERLMVLLLLEGQGAECSATPPAAAGAGAGPAPACVRRAESFMQAHADQALSLADIAREAGVPPRTLLDAFRRFRSTSPVRYLQALRLERARAMLREPSPGTRVSTIALDCGFVHLGRFASAYARRYGESPSATLGRALRR